MRFSWNWIYRLVEWRLSKILVPHNWFAWYPVKITGKPRIVWLKMVKREYHIYYDVVIRGQLDFWTYMEITGEK